MANNFDNEVENLCQTCIFFEEIAKRFINYRRYDCRRWLTSSATEDLLGGLLKEYGEELTLKVLESMTTGKGSYGLKKLSVGHLDSRSCLKATISQKEGL